MKYAGWMGCALLGLLSSAHATQYPPNGADNTLGTIAPYQGTYYDPKQGGTGIQVDLGKNGNAFVTLYTYTTTGAPLWYVLQANYVPSDEITRWTTGVIGTMTGQFYNATGGQCLGCAYTPATGVLSNYMPMLTWVNSREFKMVVGNQIWDFIAPNFDGQTDGDYLPGAWATTFTFSVGGSFPGQQNLTAVLNLTPTTFPVTVAQGSENETQITPGAKTYVSTCGTPGLSSPSTNKLCLYFNPYFGFTADRIGEANPVIFWFDPATNRFGCDTAEFGSVNGQTTYVIGPNNTHYDLYLEGPNKLVGRGINEENIPGGSTIPQGGLDFSISMIKLAAPQVAGP